MGHEPRGSGSPGGSHSSKGSSRKGTPARVTRATSLIAERGLVRVVIGTVLPGTELRILASAPDHTATVEIGKDLRAVEGVTLRILEADLTPL